MLLRGPNRSVELVGFALSLVLLSSVSCEGPSQKWKAAECVPNDPDKPPCPDGTTCLTEDYRCHTLCDNEDSSLCPLEQACFPEGVCRDYEAECDASSPCTMEGFYCETSTYSCRKKVGLGAACSGGDACWSGVCQDGYCCTTCSESCVACSEALTGQPSGTCADILAGKKRGEEDCPDPLSCDGAGGCATKEPGQPCAADLECTSSFCSPDGVCCDEACDASGCVACTEENTGVASGTCAAALEGLNPFGDCAGGLGCDGDGQCYDKPIAAACDWPYECVSGHCVDGRCCETECDEICTACARSLTGDSNGVCAPAPVGQDPHSDCGPDGCNGSGACLTGAPDGVACGQSDQCQSHYRGGGCIDGVCCESLCAGTCEACITDLTGEAEGACAPILAFHDPDSECVSVDGPGCSGAGNCKAASILTASDAQAGDWFGRSVAMGGAYAIVGADLEDGGNSDPRPDAGAAYIFRRTGAETWDGGFKVVAADAQTDDLFGLQVAISGDYAVVGAPGEDGGPGDPRESAGAVYVFHRNGLNSWDAGTKLVALDPHAGDWFGRSTAIDGDYVIVGAAGEDGGSGDPHNNAGAAYVYTRTGTNSWDTGTKLVAPDAAADDNFGDSVAISGAYAIVGAKYEDGEVGDPGNAGAAYVFLRTGSAWDAGTKLVAPDTQPRDLFGYSVGISGSFAIVGSSHEDGDSTPAAGAAYVFRRTGTSSWDGGSKLVAPDAQMGDHFGQSVATNGAFAIVGAPDKDGGVGDPIAKDVGAAYMFVRVGATWDAGTKLVAPGAQAGDKFGTSVAIGDDHAIVGANQEDGGTGDPRPDAGAAYAY